MTTFAERIKQLRTERGLTHQQLADYIGVSKSTVSMWEIGQRSPTNKRMYELADFFHVTVDYMTGHSDNSRPFHRENVAYTEDIAEVMSELGVDSDGVYMSDEEQAVRDILAVSGIKYRTTEEGKRIVTIGDKEMEIPVDEAVALSKKVSNYAVYLFEDRLIGGK